MAWPQIQTRGDPRSNGSMHIQTGYPQHEGSEVVHLREHQLRNTELYWNQEVPETRHHTRHDEEEDHQHGMKDHKPNNRTQDPRPQIMTRGSRSRTPDPRPRPDQTHERGQRMGPGSMDPVVDGMRSQRCTIPFMLQ